MKELSVARGTYENIEIVQRAVNEFDPGFGDALDVCWDEIHLKRKTRLNDVVEYAKQRARESKHTLSSQSDSRYPGPGVSLRHATGKSGITAK